MDEKILNSLLDYAREYMGADIPFNNKWIIENFSIAECKPVKLHETTSGLHRFKFAVNPLLVLHFVSASYLFEYQL